MNINMRIVGGNTLKEALERIGADMELRLAQGMKVEAELIMTESKEECPVDTGTLRASGYVKDPVIEPGKGVTVELGYGGPATKINPRTGQPSDSYAERVHENLDANHPVGKAKFLEDPLRKAIPTLGTKLAERIRGV